MIEQRLMLSGVSGWSSPVSTVYRYDALNRLTLASEKPANVNRPACPEAAAHWCQQFGYAEREAK